MRTKRKEEEGRGRKRKERKRKEEEGRGSKRKEEMEVRGRRGRRGGGTSTHLVQIPSNLLSYDGPRSLRLARKIEV
jgi:hypothetical protein